MLSAFSKQLRLALEATFPKKMDSPRQSDQECQPGIHREWQRRLATRQGSSPEAEIRGAAYASEAEIRFLQSCLLLELRSQSENDGALAARPGKSRVAKEAVVWLPVLPGT